MNINVLAIDIAKNHFQLHGVTSTGREILKKSLQRENLLEYITNLSGKFTIAMEACGGANHWARDDREEFRSDAAMRFSDCSIQGCKGEPSTRMCGSEKRMEIANQKFFFYDEIAAVITFPRKDGLGWIATPRFSRKLKQKKPPEGGF